MQLSGSISSKSHGTNNSPGRAGKAAGFSINLRDWPKWHRSSSDSLDGIANNNNSIVRGAGNRFIQVRLYWPQFQNEYLRDSSTSSDDSHDHKSTTTTTTTSTTSTTTTTTTTTGEEESVNSNFQGENGALIKHAVSRFTIRDGISFENFLSRVRKTGEELLMIESPSSQGLEHHEQQQMEKEEEKEEEHFNKVRCTGDPKMQMKYWDYEEEEWIQLNGEKEWSMAMWKLLDSASLSPISLRSPTASFHGHSGDSQTHYSQTAPATVSNVRTVSPPSPLIRQRSFHHRVLRLAVVTNQGQSERDMYNYLEMMKQALLEEVVLTNNFGGGSPPTSPIIKLLSQADTSVISPNQLQRMRAISLPVIPQTASERAQAPLSTEKTTAAEPSLSYSSSVPMWNDLFASLSSSSPSSDTDEQKVDNLEVQDMTGDSITSLPSHSDDNQERKELQQMPLPPGSPHNGKALKRKNRRRRRSNERARHERVLSGQLNLGDSNRSFFSKFMLYNDPYGSDSSNSSSSSNPDSHVLSIRDVSLVA